MTGQLARITQLAELPAVDIAALQEMTRRHQGRQGACFERCSCRSLRQELAVPRSLGKLKPLGDGRKLI
jgi:endonuclease/exonuclease/phosphatase family metal-dependent hydrolase